MARVFGAKGTLTLPSIGHPDSVGYVSCNVTFEGDTEVNNEFGDSLSMEQLIRGMSRVRGDFEAFYDSTFTTDELITIITTPGTTTDGTFVITFDTDPTPDEGITFPALLENLTVQMTRTGFHRVRGSFRSSGDVAAIS